MIEFAKYYNVTKVLEGLIKDNKLDSYTKDSCKELYVCMDTHDFWVCRILENINEDYEEEDGVYLVERNKIDKYDLIGFMNEIDTDEDKWEVKSRKDRDFIIGNLDTKMLINYAILYDDNEGLGNWDNYQCYSLEKAIEVIDGGFGILEIA